mmetsp:Transcript_25640/g.54155  ORF Transcript_25640/g.54155 Transcript_25640/m.54155 type:complete len:363 (+) Transcript_25640:204-1292(+)
MATMERRHVLDLSRGWILLGMMTLLLSTMIPTRRMQQPASSSSVASAFSLSPSPFARTRIRKRSILAAAATTGSSPTSSSHDDGEQDDSSSLPTIPLTYNEMISQATQCISDAYTHAGISRQIVRVLLPRRVEYQTRPGERIEEDANTNDRTKVNEMKLIPPDESWQGGILQLYRAACPMAVELLREMSGTFRDAGVPPRIVEDRSIDESGVDGVGLCYTQSEWSGSSSERDDEGGTGGGSFFGGDDVVDTAETFGEGQLHLRPAESGSGREHRETLQTVLVVVGDCTAQPSMARRRRCVRRGIQKRRCLRRARLLPGREGIGDATSRGTGIRSHVHPRGIRLQGWERADGQAVRFGVGGVC